jgi:threonylcarbamoyladenosine tRNA methylthiotransferase MtaB
MKIYLDSIGCRLNQSEIEKIALDFRKAGHSLTEDAEEADLIVINTCAVTGRAVTDSRKAIRHAARDGNKRIVVTGCWATLEPDKICSLPGVLQVVPNEQKDNMVRSYLHVSETGNKDAGIPREPIPGSRFRTRAFIKVQDGCDNHCTFCITRVARGKGKSTAIPEVLDDIQSALDGGSKEIVLTGVHLGSWGRDLSPTLHLRNLIEEILAKTAVTRLRLSSLEPWDVDEDFLNLWQDARLCRQLHLPLQSGSQGILKMMGRKGSPKYYAGIVEAARNVSPNIAITTDVIVGFPGEGEKEFIESLDFIRSMEFAGGHVFTYSPRPGIPAASLPDQVNSYTAHERSAKVRSAIKETSKNYMQSLCGGCLDVLWESSVESSPGTWKNVGLSDNYLKVQAESEQYLWNEISKVMICEITANGVKGLIIGK